MVRIPKLDFHTKTGQLFRSRFGSGDQRFKKTRFLGHNDSKTVFLPGPVFDRNNKLLLFFLAHNPFVRCVIPIGLVIAAVNVDRIHQQFSRRRFPFAFARIEQVYKRIPCLTESVLFDQCRDKPFTQKRNIHRCCIENDQLDRRFFFGNRLRYPVRCMSVGDKDQTQIGMLVDAVDHKLCRCLRVSLRLKNTRVGNPWRVFCKVIPATLHAHYMIHLIVLGNQIQNLSLACKQCCDSFSGNLSLHP
ncbi:MAG: hypothetical protein BWY39_01829 [Spirochaetes bacterium ADurb.Bin269]|nr:MAG: hypothetical protein BWY39_01829 [Spirochaetes bacterium ADurb.Bin269]